MAEFPALPLWTDALMGDTYHLSPAEFGAYMRLLVCAWRSPECALPDDDKKLGRMVGDQRNWPKWRPAVMAFWTKGQDGLWRQKRLTSERKYVSTSRAKKVKAGRASALKRKEAGLTPVPTQGQQPTPTPTPTEQKEDTPSPVPTTSPLTEKSLPTHSLSDGRKPPDQNVVDLESKKAKKYAWQGETFRLTVEDWRKWRRQFWAVYDLACMLDRIDEYYAENGKPKNVFFAFSGWLNNEHQKQVSRGATMPEWLRRERANA